MHIIAQKLIRWYGDNQRDLPWRKTKDPYKIWVSEIILQQTRVEQGIEYYYRFIHDFPDVKSLASADEKKVLKVWQGLGYYSRARNMHYAAKTIMEKFDGRFPGTYAEILSLKGVGAYTAGAIASFAFNLPYPAIDGNVMRVLARMFEIKQEINTAKGSRKTKEVAEELIPAENPATFNQAIIEFGALWCLPRNPKCGECPLQPHCQAFSGKTVNQLPVKKPKKKPRDRFFNYLVIHNKAKSSLYLRKREDTSDIWENLYDFPLIESEKPLTPKELIQTKAWAQLIGNDYLYLNKQPRKKKHQLSHQTLHAHFWEVKIGDSDDVSPDNFYIKDKTENLHEYPFPRLIDAYLKENIEDYSKNNDG